MRKVFRIHFTSSLHSKWMFHHLAIAVAVLIELKLFHHFSTSMYFIIIIVTQNGAIRKTSRLNWTISLILLEIWWRPMKMVQNGKPGNRNDRFILFIWNYITTNSIHFSPAILFHSFSNHNIRCLNEWKFLQSKTCHQLIDVFPLTQATVSDTMCVYVVVVVVADSIPLLLPTFTIQCTHVMF